MLIYLDLFKNIRIDVPEKFKVGERTYELIYSGYPDNGLSNDVMLRIGRKLQANMGQEDGEYISEHSKELPVEYQNKIGFIFPEWCAWKGVMCLYWSKELNAWYESENPDDSSWLQSEFIVRRCL